MNKPQERAVIDSRWAQQRLELDLDDGVKVNYVKFKSAVVNIPGLDKSDED